ncbi:MAG: tetratricopeptide repeat protein [Gemmatimonadota bacterium]
MEPALDIDELRALVGTERDPEGRAFAPLAEALRRGGHLTEAREVAERGCAVWPDFSSGQLVAARVRVDLGDLPGASALFARVLELDPENARALEEGARSSLLAGDLDGARTWALRWSAVEPQRADHAEQLLRTIDEREALEAGSEPPTAEAAGAAADALPEAPPADRESPPVATAVEAREEAEASEEAERGEYEDRAAGSAGGEELLTRTMAELLIAQGLRTEAIELFRKLVARAPESAALRERLAELEGLEAPAPQPEPAAQERATAVPVEALGPEVRPVEALGPDRVPVSELSPEALPVADLAPETRPIRELGPDRTGEEVDDEFRRWLEGLDA